MQNFGINKVHYDLCENSEYSHFNYNNGPTSKGGVPVGFELICCYLFTRAEPVPSSWENKNMLRL